jgi:hypothetical protein
MRAATSLTIFTVIVIAFAHQGLSQISATLQPTPSCSPPCLLPVMWSENFDNVTPPALPPGWMATNAQGPPPLWVTSNSGVPSPPADSQPNAAFVDDPAVVSDKRLDSLAFPIFVAYSAQLTFRQNFNLEASEIDPNLGFDAACWNLAPTVEIHFKT